MRDEDKTEYWDRKWKLGENDRRLLQETKRIVLDCCGNELISLYAS